jgi:predicted enzyme related to lactoylglutathione lyase
MDVLDVGRMAVFSDPTGAFISVWQAGTHPGAQLVNEPGTWSWTELLTSDPDSAKTFYAAVFGWSPVTQSGPMGDYTEWQVDGRSVGGMMARPPMLPEQVPDHWAVYFSVVDTDAAVARIAELGGTVVVPPMDIEPGRFAAALDPTGAAFNVIALSPERAGT